MLRTGKFTTKTREQLAVGGKLTARGRKARSNANITVVLRKRPLIEIELEQCDMLEVHEDKRTVRIREPRRSLTGEHYMEEHEYSFDRVFDETMDNADIYATCVLPIINDIFTTGSRTSIFAYGQTGSGKTFTMLGGKTGALNNRGLVEMAYEDIEHLITHQNSKTDKNFTLNISIYEVYCNRVYDLLNDRSLVKSLDSSVDGGLVVKGLSTLNMSTSPDALSTVMKSLSSRVTASNSMNQASSRGHVILTFEVFSKGKKFGKLAFIDLAGSERAADHSQTKKQTQADGADINRSLLALKECIRALDAGCGHVPFRDSELTKNLRDFLVTHGAKTVMIAHASPSAKCSEQTINTVRYAHMFLGVRKHCDPILNEPDVAGSRAAGYRLSTTEGRFESPGSQVMSSPSSDTTNKAQEPKTENERTNFGYLKNNPKIDKENLSIDIALTGDDSFLSVAKETLGDQHVFDNIFAVKNWEESDIPLANNIIQRCDTDYSRDLQVDELLELLPEDWVEDHRGRVCLRIDGKILDLRSSTSAQINNLSSYISDLIEMTFIEVRQLSNNTGILGMHLARRQREITMQMTGVPGHDEIEGFGLEVLKIISQKQLSLIRVTSQVKNLTSLIRAHRLLQVLLEDREDKHY